MQTTKLKFVGSTVPLVMHNGQMADPLNPHTKALKKLTGKKKKTDEDLLEIQRVEWMGGLYFDPKIGPYIPAEALEACIFNGAKLSRLGKDFKAACFVKGSKIPLLYEGPRELEALWATGEFKDIRGVVVSNRRVMRCRPLFNPPWSVEFEIEYDDINEDTLIQVCGDAGRKAGLCEMRPRYGRFEVEVLAHAEKSPELAAHTAKVKKGKKAAAVEEPVAAAAGVNGADAE
jgi:hypothetical protein